MVADPCFVQIAAEDCPQVVARESRLAALQVPKMDPKVVLTAPQAESESEQARSPEAH
jgi:hypothetical protein